MVETERQPPELNTRALETAGASFSLAAVIPVILSLVVGLIASAVGGKGYADTDWFKYLAYLISPVCIAGVAVFFFRRTKLHPKTVYAPCK